MRYAFSLMPLAVAIGIFVGCRSSNTGDAEKVYPLKGAVVSVNPSAREITIDHEDIPGLMKAMKMTFSVEDAKLLEGLKPGSHVEGKVKESSGKYILTELKSQGSHEGHSKDAEKIRAALAKLPPEDRALAEAQRLCPVTDEPLGSMGMPIKLILKGQAVFVCCKACRADAEKDPDGMLKKVASFKAQEKPNQ